MHASGFTFFNVYMIRKIRLLKYLFYLNCSLVFVAFQKKKKRSNFIVYILLEHLQLDKIQTVPLNVMQRHFILAVFLSPTSYKIDYIRFRDETDGYSEQIRPSDVADVWSGTYGMAGSHHRVNEWILFCVFFLKSRISCT